MFFEKPKIYKNYLEDWESNVQIIFCENGVFKRVKTSSVSYIVKKTTLKKLGLKEEDIVFDKVGENPVTLEEKPYMKKKIPNGVIKTILKFYQVYAKKGLEAKLNVWFDNVNNKYFIECPFQQNTAVSVTEYTFDNRDIVWSDELVAKYPEKLKLKERKKAKEIEKVLETHSHHEMSCTFSSVDNNTDYFRTVGFKLIGVYKTVLSYPTMDLRYFLSPYLKGRPLTEETFKEDIVLFEYDDIVDRNDDSCDIYDFNKFAQCIGISNKELFGE